MNLLKNLKFAFFFFIVFTTSNVSAQSLAFETIEREDGTAFFAVDRISGQVSYLLDYGSNPGVWKNFGGTITRVSKKQDLEFNVIQRVDGTAFFCADGSTGQLYYMLDYGSNAGAWESYGGLIPQ